MQEKDSLIKQINKLMIEKVIEISIIITLVSLSIPAWNAFAAKMSDVDIIKLEDCKLDFKQSVDNGIDYLSVKNTYAINKNYKIYLEIDKNINPYTVVTINNKEYFLANFYSKEVGNNLKFTLIDKNIVASVDAYSIMLEKEDGIKEYHYIFEENHNF